MQRFSSRRGATAPRVRGGAAVPRIEPRNGAGAPVGIPVADASSRMVSRPGSAVPAMEPGFAYYHFAPTLGIILIALFGARLTEMVPALNVLRPTLLASIAAMPLVIMHSSRSVLTRTIKHPVLRLTAGYGLWALGTAPLALWPGLAVESAIGLFIPAMVVCFIILACAPTARNVDRMSFGFVVAVVIHVSYLLAVGATRAGDRLTSSGSLDPNDLGSLVAMAFPLAIGLALRSRGRVRAISAFAALVFVITLMRTGSRGGTLAFVAATLVFVFGFPARQRWALVIAVVFAMPLAWTLGPPEYRERMRTMLALEEDYNQTDYLGRKAVRQRAQEYFKEHPVTGVGMFCFAIAEGQRNKEIGRTGKWSAPHNAYWMALSELGFVGGVFFVGMIVSAGVYGWRCWRWRTPDGTPVVFHRPEYLASVVGFSIGAYFLSHAYFWPLFGLVALSGLAGLVSRTPGAATPDPVAPATRRRALGGPGAGPGHSPAIA